MLKAYVSATYNDLKEYRQKAERVLRRMGYLDVAMEYYVAENRRSLDRCLEDVASCDLYVGLFAWRYGWIPPHEDRRRISITEREYRGAVELDKPRLLFLLDEAAAWPPAWVDDNKAKIKKLRRELAADRQPALFSSPEGFEAALTAALSQLAPPRKTSSAPQRSEIDWAGYREAMSRRYRHVDLEALAEPQRDDFLRLRLQAVFVEPSVRASPPPVELPKSTWELLAKRGEVHPDDLPTDLTAGISPDHIRRVAAYRDELPQPALAALADPAHPNTILLGDPGAGKSTLARFVLLSLLDPDGDAALREALDGYLPLLIELKTYAGLCAAGKCGTFFEFIDHLGKTEGWRLSSEALESFLATDGRVLAIFDGLDEIVEPEERERISRQIAGFASDHPQARIVATSRVIGYRRKILTDAGFVHLTLQDLNEQQVTAFAERWYALALADNPADAQQRTERILRAFRDSASIRQLAGNPMLLTIMAMIGRHQELPRERWKLYEHATSVLIQHWDVNKHLRDRKADVDFVTEDDKKELLRRLAYLMQSGVAGIAGNYIQSEQLHQEFESYLKERYAQPPDRAALVARSMIAELRERNFILSLHGANLYGFVHRAFLEYYCASAVVHRFEKTHELSPEQLKRQVYGGHWPDPAWHEVLRLICGMVDARFAEEIIVFLARDVAPDWLECRVGDPNFRAPLQLALAIQCLTEVRSFSLIPDAARCVMLALCRLFDAVLLSADLVGFLIREVNPYLPLIASAWPDREILAAWLRQQITTEFFNHELSELARSIATLGTGSPPIREILMDYLASTKPEARSLAAFALAVDCDRPIEDQLVQLATEDPDARVRLSALKALSDRFLNDRTRDPLFRRSSLVRNEPDPRNRTLAVTHLMAIHLLEDLHHFHRIVTDDPDDGVRQQALYTVFLLYPKHPDTLELLIDRARHDKSPTTEGRLGVRGASMDALAHLWPEDPRTRTVLRRLAKTDPVPSLRRRAKMLLATLDRPAAAT